MNDLLQINARKQIARLVRRELEFGYQPNALRPLPRFYGTRGDISCRDDEIFGLHVVVNAIRGIRRSVNFASSAVQAYKAELYAPSVALSYTCAFHSLGAHLSAEGRSCLDRVIWSSGEDEVVDSPVEAVIGILTSSNRWTFEPRKRSHRARWGEIDQLAHREDYKIPSCFDRLFQYMYAGEFRRGASIMEILADPDAHRLKLPEMLPDFLDRIAAVRHLALYGAAGEDPNAVEGLWNNEPYADKYLHRQAEEFVHFAHELLRHAAEEISGLFTNLDFSDAASQDLGRCVRIPWYDDLKLETIEDGNLKDALLRIEKIVAGNARGIA